MRLASSMHILVLTMNSDPVFYDVYTQLSELHLNNIGLNVEWSDVDVGDNELDRWSGTRKYFDVRFYRLPIAQMKS